MKTAGGNVEMPRLLVLVVKSIQMGFRNINADGMRRFQASSATVDADMISAAIM
jgi:hypothetical protein